MAYLTNYNFELARIDRGAVEPRAQTSVFGGILGGVDQVVDGLSGKFYNDRLDAERDKDKGINQLAAGLFSTDKTANNIPQAAKDAVGTLDSTQAGVSQGVLPSSAYAVQLQNLTGQVMAAHPEAAYNIMEYMKSSGHYASMFPQLERQQQVQKSRQDATISGMTANYSYYIDNGGLNTTPYDEAVSAGQQLRVAHAQQAQAQQALENAQKQEGINVEARKLHLAEAERAGLTGVQSEISARVGPIFTSLQALIASAPPGQQDRMAESVIPQVDNMVAAAKSSAYQHLTKMGLGTAENFKTVNDELDAQANGIKLIFSDRTGQLENTLKHLKTQYGIDTATAAPVISRLTSLIGSNQVATLLGSASLLDVNLQDQLRKEWQKVTSGSDGQIHLNNIISIMRGNSNLKDYTPKDASKYIGGVVSGKQASERAIINGGNDVDHGVYMNTMSNVLNAVHSLTPAADSTDLVNASKLISTQNSRQAIDRLTADPGTKERGEALGMASHAASIKLLQDFNQGSDQATFGGLPVGNKSQKIVFDNNSGTYKVRIDTSVYPGSSPQTIAHLKSAPIFSSIQQRVDAMNATLDHAVKTSKYDTDIPKNVTPLELRKAYANNTPIPTGSSKPGEEPPEQRWQKAEQNLEDVLKRFPLQVMMQDGLR